MARANEDGGVDSAPRITGIAAGAGADVDELDALVLYLDELEALERNGECIFDDADATLTHVSDTMASMTATADAAAAIPAVFTMAEPPRKRFRRVGLAKTHYKRQKEELATLRDGVDVLTSQLELLHARQRCRRHLDVDSASRVVCDDGHVTLSAGADGKSAEGFKKRALKDLKERAARELKSRHDAKVENKRLQKLAKDAREFTTSMEGAFAKHPTPPMAELFNVSPVMRVTDPTDAQVHSELERCLDARYTSVSHMRDGFGSCLGTGNLGSDMRTINVLVKNEKDAPVLLNNSRVLPFSVQFIDDVVWGGNNMELMQIQNASIQIVQRFESTVFLNKQYRVRDPNNHEIMIPMYMVVRRFAAKDCIYMAWESIGEWPNTSTDKSSQRFVIREHGWASVLPFLGLQSRSPVSTLRASIIVEPEVVGDAKEEHRAHVQLLSEAVVPTHEMVFTTRMQKLENMLLDHSARSSQPL